jgi:hypothetical protein
VRVARACSTIRADARDRVAGDFALSEIGFGEQREHAGAVAQARAIVGPRQAVVALGRAAFERGGEHFAGPRAVAEHGERGGDLRLRHRRLEDASLVSAR